jgi:integrase
MATVYRDAKSPFWFARFQVWDARRETWKLAGKSTKEIDRSRALAVAAALEVAALEAGPKKGRAGLDPAKAARLVSSIAALSSREEPPPERALPPREFAKGWLAEKKDAKTRASYQAVLAHLEEWARAHGVPVNSFASISPADAEAWRDWLAARKRLSRNRVNFHLTVAGGLWIKATRLGLAARNPFAAVQRLALDDEADNRAARPFEAEEIAALERAALESGISSGQEWALAIRLGAVAGARLGDATSMLAGAVSPSGDLDYLPRKTRRSGAGKRVLFPVAALDAGLARRLVETAAAASGPASPLMPSLARCRVNSRGGLSAQFRAIMEAAGIPLEIVGPVTSRTRWSHGFHSLRHAAITRAMRLGLPPELRMALFGHSSMEVHGKYSHWNTEELREQILKRIPAAE